MKPSGNRPAEINASENTNKSEQVQSQPNKNLDGNKIVPTTEPSKVEAPLEIKNTSPGQDAAVKSEFGIKIISEEFETANLDQTQLQELERITNLDKSMT